MIERKFTDLSKLTYRIFTLERKVVHTVRVTVMEWDGVFGDGSRGNDDGVFMRVTTLAALSHGTHMVSSSIFAISTMYGRQDLGNVWMWHRSL